jgi:hypothetical protein
LSFLSLSFVSFSCQGTKETVRPLIMHPIVISKYLFPWEFQNSFLVYLFIVDFWQLLFIKMPIFIIRNWLKSTTVR